MIPNRNMSENTHHPPLSSALGFARLSTHLLVSTWYFLGGYDAPLHITKMEKHDPHENRYTVATNSYSETTQNDCMHIDGVPCMRVFVESEHGAILRLE